LAKLFLANTRKFTRKAAKLTENKDFNLNRNKQVLQHFCFSRNIIKIIMIIIAQV